MMIITIMMKNNKPMSVQQQGNDKRNNSDKMTSQDSRDNTQIWIRSSRSRLPLGAPCLFSSRSCGSSCRIIRSCEDCRTVSLYDWILTGGEVLKVRLEALFPPWIYCKWLIGERAPPSSSSIRKKIHLRLPQELLYFAIYDL